MWEILKSWRKGEEGGGGKGRKEEQSSDGSTAYSPVARNFSTSVNFKDLNICLEHDDGEDEGHHPTPADSECPSALPSPRHAKLRRLERNKLIIIMVGLPGRGKTFLCNKLVCYLNWLGHHTKLFNVGSYRRRQKDEGEVQDASFFDKSNLAGLEARQRALDAALDDLKMYLASEHGQVAIFDATNTTHERRQHLVDEFHGKFQYLFIESICTDDQVLEQNYRYKMKYSPDYQGMSEEQALKDFKARILKYEEVYEPLEDRTRHYIKLIDMVTGRGHMDINRISGYIPGKIVFFLMQVCKAGMAQERKIWLTRHGESLFNLEGKIGGNAGLSDLGKEYALALPEALMSRLPLSRLDEPIPVSVWTSTLRRTIETAEYLVFPKLRWKALDEIHAGSCDGLTYEEIAERFPDEYEARGKDKLRYRYPAGESYLDVIQRLEPVIIELEREKECVCVVAHQAVLRAVYGYFTAASLADIPTLEIPLHSLIELKPRPDGTMQVEILPVTVDPGTGAHPSLPPLSHPEGHQRAASLTQLHGSPQREHRTLSIPAAATPGSPTTAQPSTAATASQTLVFPRLAPIQPRTSNPSPLRALPFGSYSAMSCIQEALSHELGSREGSASEPAGPATNSGTGWSRLQGEEEAVEAAISASVWAAAAGSSSAASSVGDGDEATAAAAATSPQGLDARRGSKLNVLLPLNTNSSIAPTPANSLASEQVTPVVSQAATPHASSGGAP